MLPTAQEQWRISPLAKPLESEKGLISLKEYSIRYKLLFSDSRWKSYDPLAYGVHGGHLYGVTFLAKVTPSVH